MCPNFGALRVLQWGLNGPLARAAWYNLVRRFVQGPCWGKKDGDLNVMPSDKATKFIRLVPKPDIQVVESEPPRLSDR